MEGLHRILIYRDVQYCTKHFGHDAGCGQQALSHSIGTHGQRARRMIRQRARSYVCLSRPSDARWLRAAGLHEFKEAACLGLKEKCVCGWTTLF
eukprot:1109630-Pelagomonas_calceolata.AAC.10